VFTSTTLIDGVESKTVDFKNMFLFPSAVAALAAIALAVFFHPPKQVDATLDGASAPAH